MTSTTAELNHEDLPHPVTDPAILTADRFSVIAADGLGRNSSITAHSMAYFRGSLYLGTTCGNPTEPKHAPRILRYDADRGEWHTVFKSPIIDPVPRSSVPDRSLGELNPMRRGKTPLPRDSGYRSMCVFQGKSDDAPALYVSSMSRSGALILRSADGVTFETVSEPGLGDPDSYSFRGLVGFGGHIFASPVGTITDDYLDRNHGREARVFVSDDPRSGRWVEAAPPGFGDPTNLAVYTLRPAFGRLYAGTGNPDRGFQLWQTAARGTPPFAWTPVIVDGAGAFNYNYSICAMVEFKGALYVGGGISGFGYDKTHDVGPASCELLRVYPDGKWDLIAGQMRFTPDGLKVPLSLLGPGLGDFFNSVIWSLGVHNNVLYLGTHQWEAFRCLEINAPNIVGGYQLWASSNGENWTPVIEDGRGNPADVGVRTLQSTPHGLFVGTSNHSQLFSTMAMRRRSKPDFPYGFEVLLGR